MSYEMGYFEGAKDPGNRRYYAQMAEHRDAINAILLPAGGRVTYVGMSVGILNVIWLFGESETGFAGGRTLNEVIESLTSKIFGGL